MDQAQRMILDMANEEERYTRMPKFDVGDMVGIATDDYIIIGRLQQYLYRVFPIGTANKGKLKFVDYETLLGNN